MGTALVVTSTVRVPRNYRGIHRVDDLRLIDNAMDRHAIDNSRSPGDPAAWADLQPYLKKNIVLYDSMGNAVATSTRNGSRAERRGVCMACVSV